MPLGVLYTILAYVLWGLFPFYFHALNDVNPFEILSHRMVWSFVLVAIILLVLKRWDWIKDLFRKPKILLIFLLSSALVSANWGTYVYAIVSGQTLEASLGYFINPLMSVALGALFLKEKLSSTKKLAIGMAVVAVLWITILTGHAPWLGLALAVSFALYGLIRKMAPLGSLEGFALETALMSPFALAYLLMLNHQSELYFATASLSTQWLLVAAGPITAIPLLLFASGVRMIPYSTAGVIQYLSPTIVFFIGIFCFGEPFSWTLFIGFLIIWIAVFIFTWDSIRRAGIAGR